TCIDTAIDRRGTNLFSDLKLFFKYILLIKKHKPCIVLSYTVKPNVYGGIASRLLRIPHIANITGLGDSVSNVGRLQQFVLALTKFALKKSKKVFFQNKSNKEFYEQRTIVQTAQTQLIPGSGVNLTRFAYLPYPVEKDECIRFLFIGRILKDKGIGELLEAVTSIYQEKNNITCDLVGFYEDETFKQAITVYENLGAGRFLGVSKDISSLLKEYHAVILPSYHEGMANVLLEASASGRPVLASNVPGCQETFDEGISGIGFEAKSVNSLYSAIKKFLSLTTAQREAMGKAGRAKMEREFDIAVPGTTSTFSLKNRALGYSERDLTI
ncbi:MAG: glycosyltransferase family 1 protein, partial [Spirochaetia bacterium]|nr:glycosyltransferase family 1 protein [Spirochaetia bacterium]